MATDYESRLEFEKLKIVNSNRRIRILEKLTQLQEFTSALDEQPDNKHLLHICLRGDRSIELEHDNDDVIFAILKDAAKYQKEKLENEFREIK